MAHTAWLCQGSDSGVLSFMPGVGKRLLKGTRRRVFPVVPRSSVAATQKQPWTTANKQEWPHANSTLFPKPGGGLPGAASR